FFSSRRRHTRSKRDWSSDVCSSDLIAKRLLDFGYHPPTIYFPLNVEEAMMIEPTETESKETLDDFIAAMVQISEEVEQDPEVVQEAPHLTIVKRMDEATAARKPILRYRKE